MSTSTTTPASTQGKSWLAAAAAPPIRQGRKKGLIFHTPWQFSYMRRIAHATSGGGRSRGGGGSPNASSSISGVPEEAHEGYSAAIKNIAEVGTAEEFWSVYNHLIRPHKLSVSTDYFLFRAGIRPMWEDEANKMGGRWTIRVHKSLTSKAYEDLALAIVGEQFENDDVLGIACSVRFQDDVLAIWIRNASDKDSLHNIVNVAKRILNFPSHSRLVREWEFKPHRTSM